MLYIEGLLFLSFIQLVIHTKQKRIPKVLVKALNVSSCFPIGLKFNQRIILREKKKQQNKEVYRCVSRIFVMMERGVSAQELTSLTENSLLMVL